MRTTRNRSIAFVYFVLRQLAETYHPSITFLLTFWSDKRADWWFPFRAIYHCFSQTFPMVSKNPVCEIQPKGMIKSFKRNLGMCIGAITGIKWRGYPAIFGKRPGLCKPSRYALYVFERNCEIEGNTRLSERKEIKDTSITSLFTRTNHLII